MLSPSFAALRRAGTPLVGLAFLLPLTATHAHAQVTKDVANHAYFVGNATFDTNIGNYDIFVGKNNAADFNTLPGPYLLTITAGANIGYYSNYYPAFTFPKGFYEGVNAFGVNQVSITGGDVNRFYARDSSIIAVSDGNIQNANAVDSGRVYISGGTTNHSQTVGLTATFISGGSVTTADAFTGGTINISGGYTGDARVYDNGNLKVSGGTVSIASTLNSATGTLTAGQVSTANATDTSTLNLGNSQSPGVLTVTEAKALASGTVNINGFAAVTIASAQSSGTLNVSKGTVFRATGSDTSTVNVSGGSIDTVYGYNSSTINISGGSITDLYGYDNSVFNITGGQIGQNTIRLFGQSVLNVTGTNLSLSLLGTGSDINGAYTQYVLTGILSDGSSLAGVGFRDYDGGYQVGNPGSNPNGPSSPVNFVTASAAAPEPATLALLTFPVAGVWLRRRQRGHA